MAFQLRPSVRRRARSESGSIIILTALSMVLMLGILAFAIDGSFLYTERNRMAAAADAAAKSAAIELKRRPLITQAELDAFAQHEAIAHGFAASDVLPVNHPPDGTSAFSGNPGMVQVKVSRPTNTFFASVVNAAWSSVSPLAAAVAGAAAPGNCLIANGNADMQNNTTLTGCNMAVGGTLAAGECPAGVPTPKVTAGSYAGSCSNVTGGQPKPSDPFSGLAAPTVTGVGCPGGVAGTAASLAPGCYTSIATSVATLQAGKFQVSGKIDISNTLTGNNVLLYLTSTGSIEPRNNSTLTLTAETSGTYQGIVIYGDPGSVIDGKNTFDLNLGGAVYMPGSNFDLKNKVNVTAIGNCLLFVINNYSTKNTGSFTSASSGCLSSFGGAAFLGVALAE